MNDTSSFQAMKRPEIIWIPFLILFMIVVLVISFIRYHIRLVAKKKYIKEYTEKNLQTKRPRINGTLCHSNDASLWDLGASVVNPDILRRCIDHPTPQFARLDNENLDRHHAFTTDEALDLGNIKRCTDYPLSPLARLDNENLDRYNAYTTAEAVDLGYTSQHSSLNQNTKVSDIEIEMKRPEINLDRIKSKQVLMSVSQILNDSESIGFKFGSLCKLCQKTVLLASNYSRQICENENFVYPHFKHYSYCNGIKANQNMIRQPGHARNKSCYIDPACDSGLATPCEQPTSTQNDQNDESINGHASFFGQDLANHSEDGPYKSERPKPKPRNLILSCDVLKAFNNQTGNQCLVNPSATYATVLPKYLRKQMYLPKYEIPTTKSKCSVEETVSNYLGTYSFTKRDDSDQCDLDVNHKMAAPTTQPDIVTYNPPCMSNYESIAEPHQLTRLSDLPVTNQYQKTPEAKDVLPSRDLNFKKQQNGLIYWLKIHDEETLV